VINDELLKKSQFGNEVIFSSDLKFQAPNAVSSIVASIEDEMAKEFEELDVEEGEELDDLGIDGSQFHKDWAALSVLSMFVVFP